MKFNEKLMARMRAATRSLVGRDPMAATAAIQDALKILQPTQKQAAPEPAASMRDINPPPAHARTQAPPPPPPPERPATRDAPSPTAAMDEVLKNLVPEMMAQLDRLGPRVKGMDLPGAMGMPAAEAAPDLPGQFVDGSFTNAAGTRAYKLYIPASASGGAMPLVVMLHGCTQNPDDFARGTQMNLLAEERQCLVVYPAQSQQANASRCWNWFNAGDQLHGQGEPSIIAGITRTIMDHHAVDPSQVYVAGLSAGGAMATIMGTLYPELYAAVGVHSGLPYGSAQDLPSALAAMQGNLARSQAPGRAIPIIVFHGDQDKTVHPANGDALIQQGAHSAATRPVVEPGKVTNGHAYTRTVHQRADGTPQAEQWLIHGAGHAWSGGSAHGSYTDAKGPDASREMMRFFQTKR
jgi:poly(hydroxyalkanoate) depolymerase family esterase